MDVVSNPYQSPTSTGAPDHDSLRSLADNAIAGLALTTVVVTSLGAVGRCVVEFDLFERWRQGAAPVAGGSYFAILVLAVATWMLLALNISLARFVQVKERTFCRLLVIVATVAMLVRLLSDPSSIWTPMWPTYSLTFSAIVALGLLLLQINRRFPHH